MNIKRNHWVQIIVVGIVVAVLAIIAPVTTVLNSREGERKRSNAVHTDISPFDVTVTNGVSSFNGLLLNGNISSIDPVAPSFKIHFVGVPVGTLDTPADEGDLAYNRLSSNIRLVVAGKETVFKKGSVISSFDIVIPIDEGSTNRYPFDAYSTIFDVALFANSSINQTVPLAFALTGAVQSWSTTLDIVDDQNGSGIVFLQVKMSRSWTTRLFSMMIVIIMWVLSLGVFVMAATLWLRGRKVEPPTIAVTGALLFALPSLRNSQPGAPIIGASIDVAGFMWNMLLVAVSSVLLLTNYIIKYKREKPSKP